MDNKLIVEGFLFETAEMFEEAKKEAEAISYIRTKTDLTDSSNALKIYSKLVENQNFKTPIGVGFLKDLYDFIVASGKVSAENLRPIGVKLPKKTQEQSKEILKPDSMEDKKLKNQIIYLQSKLKNGRIIICFLVIIIVAMFGITLFHDNSPLKDAEERIQNKYAAWAEELSEREAAVSKREAAFDNE